MTDNNKTPELKGLSPKGTFKYPHLVDPDYGTDDYPKKDGELNCRLILSEEDAEKFRAVLADLHKEADRLGQIADAKRKPADRKKKPYILNEIGTDVYDDDEKNPQPTGEVEFLFKTLYSGIAKKTGKPWKRTLPLFDAKGQPIKGKPPAIWGGTIGRLGFLAKPYYIAGQASAGVSLWLEAVKIIELHSGSGGANASKWGMDEDEGDYEYTHDPMTDDESGTDSYSDDDDDGSGDF